MKAYADTSFLVSLYALDIHSALAAREMAKTDLPLLLTPFGELELLNALHLRVFRKEVKRAQLRVALSLFRHDIAAGVFFLKPFDSAVFERAQRLSRRRTSRLGARTLDILHVASALELKVKMFLTFDRRQAELAKAEGLMVLPGTEVEYPKKP